eukprot:CAMPEP_0117010090 /NCGR_PEP_ID=MMETSP0472-20121206/8987_1 /TAXON_ID=693140 ORGANISM="Tiarina fusus, Strain LIS" /NCGR_SAMPLE_ID=MMETSP0472 /ASSEMBLY_ACC=CAM_ASM_000603 /LENGTH=195 /DNA_ID=CAMNT_0004712545 /DNA_START=157 /DNA_END=742 /DNA_ORIENTATION=+
MSQEKSLEELQMDLAVHKNLRRRAEDIDYWRKRAGWFDDDISMKEFNNGVYDTYYQADDDGSSSRPQSGGGGLSVVGGSKGLGTMLKIGAAVVAVAFAILLFRALSRRSSSSRKKESSSKNTSSDTKQLRILVRAPPGLDLAPAGPQATTNSWMTRSQNLVAVSRVDPGAGAVGPPRDENLAPDQKADQRKKKSW